MQRLNHILACTALALLLGSCYAAPYYTGTQTNNFDGSVFFNKLPTQKTVADLAGLAFGNLTEAADWPDWRSSQAHKVAQDRVLEGMAVTFVNHSTFLIQVDGLNILTDPIWADRASPVQWAGPKRVQAPGVRLADLPAIDVVLISHNHYDHLDEGTLRQLLTQQDTAPVIIAGLGNGQLLQTFGYADPVDLDWEASHRVASAAGTVEFIFSEARHRSGRGVGDQMKTLWGAFVIKTSQGNVYFAGDTGYGPHFKHTGDVHGPFRLALLPIGAYQPRWFMADIHTDPAEAVQAHLDLRSEQSFGMHFGTFQLTYEGIDKPQEDLQVALAAQDVDTATFEVLAPGVVRIF